MDAPRLRFRLDIDGISPSPAVIVRPPTGDIFEGRRMAARFFREAYRERILEHASKGFCIRYDGRAA